MKTVQAMPIVSGNIVWMSEDIQPLHIDASMYNEYGSVEFWYVADLNKPAVDYNVHTSVYGQPVDESWIYLGHAEQNGTLVFYFLERFCV